MRRVVVYAPAVVQVMPFPQKAGRYAGEGESVMCYAAALVRGAETFIMTRSPLR